MRPRTYSRLEVPPSHVRKSSATSVPSSALSRATGRSTGKLFSDLAPGFRIKDRKDFDELLNGLARAGLLTLATDSFTSKEDDRQISYKKATLTHEGRNPDTGDLPVTLRDAPEAAAPGRSRSRKSTSAKQSEPTDAPLTPEQEHLAAALRAWRKSLAASLGKPAFIILADRTLHAIAARHPRTLAELGATSGIGPDKLERYGAAIIALCRGEQVGSESEQTLGRRTAPPIKQQSNRATQIPERDIEQLAKSGSRGPDSDQLQDKSRTLASTGI